MDKRSRILYLLDGGNTWSQVQSLQPETNVGILNQYVLYNKNNTIANKLITIEIFHSKFGSSLKIIDIDDTNGNILKINSLGSKLQSHYTPDHLSKY